MQEWPEGSAADQEAARERYEAGIRESTRVMRAALRADLRSAHFGTAIVIFVSILVSSFSDTILGLAVTGVFAVIFGAKLTLDISRGIPRAGIVRRAYCFTFGWAKWL